MPTDRQQKRARDIVAALAGVFVLTACEVEQTGEGELPDVDVDVSGGDLPELDVDAPDVDVGTREEQVEVPTDIDVETEERTITVPDVDIDAPDREADTAAGEEETER